MNRQLNRKLVRLVRGIVVSSVFIAFVMSLPKCWPVYLRILDVRVWSFWKGVGVGVVLVESLILIRLWPTTKRQNRKIPKKCLTVLKIGDEPKGSR